MIGPVARRYILIGLLSSMFVSIASFDTTNLIDKGPPLGVPEENKAKPWYFNYSEKRNGNLSFENAEKAFKNKADILSRLFKIHIDRLKNQTDQVELVFLVDASGSVGLKNFQCELNFVKNLLSDFIVEPSATRVAIVTFGGRRNIRRNVDQISRGGEDDHKCYLLNKQLNNINYTGGGTYTRGALIEALRILEKGRQTARKAIFLITDGFSNGGDPRPAANLLKSAGATIFTFGIRTGNVQELHDIASFPGYTHSYFLDSFAEFEALARRALHRDLRTGKYVPVTPSDNCNTLCSNVTEIENDLSCCDTFATCSCGIATGHYACICTTGYFGSGLKGSCQPCPNGTYASEEVSGDSTSTCVSCPDVNHVTIVIPATSMDHCVCASGFITDGNKCEVITCPKLRIPNYGYLVKASACNNVVHAACGIRCRIGFYLTGDSIRLCGKDGSWSGNEPKCLLKTCAALRAPSHGRMRCQNEEDQHLFMENYTAYPIDTRCQFRCDTGYRLRGSKIRNCLPLSQWDGLKAACKAIKCEPLKRLPNGRISPEICSGPEKVPFATNCTIKCKKGFVLEGPRSRLCGGRSGVWTQRRNINRCTDNSPPTITCPSDITVKSLPGKNYAYVNWTSPIATDNADESPSVWSKPYVTVPWKVKIGTRTVVYVAQDSAGNTARCKFKVKVRDAEPPMIENCINPPIFFTDNGVGISNITWDEPGFYDNSRTPVRVEQNYRPGESRFLIGFTEVVYNAIDKYDNKASCALNITIKDVCQEIPEVLNGYANCSSTSANETNECAVACGTGFEFATDVPNSRVVENLLLLKCNTSNQNSTVEDYIPECSVSNNEPVDNLASKAKKNAKRNDNVDKSKSRTKKKKEKIEIKFRFLGKIIEENFENPREGIEKLRQKTELMSQSGKLDLLDEKTNQEIAKLALNLHLVFKNFEELCEPGSVLKKHSCVKCPLGTFFDSSTKRCRPCPFGEYEDTSGSLKCKRCPGHTSTRKMHSKSLRDCTPMCQPGHYSRKKRHHGGRLALDPCSKCDIGFYQPEYGQTNCLSCPSNTTTENRGAKNTNECLPLHKIEVSICEPQSCLNGAQCVQEEDSFSCECLDYYVGSKCETFRNPCDSSPCLHEGMCNVRYSENNTVNYSCTCETGYTGQNCELRVDECSLNPCQNNGTCVSTESDYSCECRDGFEGEFCEITVDHCDPSPCMEGSTCRTVNESWQCFCRPGFLGRHCNLLACDWIPCHGNSYCVNVEEENATRMSYRCECNDGYTGENCTISVDHCGSLPCRNNGECFSGISNYTCKCPVPFTGRNCETGKYSLDEYFVIFKLLSDYVMHFTKSGTTDYVSMKGPTINLVQLTTCLWLQSKDTFNYGTVLSYATQYYDNAFTLTDYNGLVVYMNGHKVVTDIKVNDGYWHFVCITWETENGAWSVFIDGILRDNGSRLAKGTIVQGNGTLVIGQEQDRVGGGFSESESFLGKITLLDVWSTVLTATDVLHLFNTCDKYHGNVIAWSQVQEHAHGDVAILNSPFCRGCPLPVVPFKGNINVSDDSLEITYYCDPGYVVRFRGKEHRSLKVKCLKQGQWEGYYTPICARRKCSFPGYFPRGRIQGKSYFFGDEIHYSCLSGYELRGNPHRICNVDGKWSGLPPVCIGRTCKNLLAPEHGDIEYVIEEYERDDLSILQVGQQLEFKCDAGFHLAGEKFLTCLESGTWDHQRPTCEVYGCPSPKKIEHGYIIFSSSSSNNLHEISATNLDTETSNTTLERNYYFDDVIGYSCHPGYKFQGNHNLLTEFKLRCNENGTWSGFVPDCMPLTCPSPRIVNNGKMFLKTQNGTVELSKKEVASNSTDKDATLIKNDGFEKQFDLGSQILIKCHVGYKLIGDIIRTCMDNEEWSSTSPSCEPYECSILNFPLFKHFKRAAVTNDHSSIWNNDTEALNDIKYYNGSYKNLEYSVENYNYTKKIVLACKNNNAITFIHENISIHVPDLTWSCNENGKWEINHLQLNSGIIENIFDNRTDICQELMCPLVTIPEYGYITDNSNNDSRIVNNTITIKCRHGYILEGNGEIFCFPNSTWSAIPSCKPVTCGKPSIPANAVLKEDNIGTTNFTFGNMITYQCLPGYLMFGQPNARCLANGKWSRVYSKCSKLSCNKPKIPPGVTVHGRSYLYQDQLTYVCPNGKRQGLITCKADGRWSEPPNCAGN
ncbi:Sushi, von Willebrand factor type A, EGF and pentraxin domain-containing protein 1 [Dufourea novaeangliae]|uniref:Sushi, von Willebrand factor type A, EGF and pentraxin domain-containing protein 1 n=1 Tax=Dufourea novaeangliae TaxID=178035 RepID=A0A154PDW7_DUFNO|nr:Sushi, von Willebrand factor type A, EGF and pentraxin domain-containing protein 1 [Dufourea novaeangliae]